MNIVFGIIAIIIGIVLFFKGLSRQRLAQLIEDTPTSRTTDINSFGLVEIKGTIECDDCTETPGSGDPCVWYRVVVEERETSFGGRGRSSRWITTRDEEFGVTFQVNDGYGTFDVTPWGAQVDVPEITEGDRSALASFLTIDCFMENQKVSVWALYPGTEVYVLGEVQPHASRNAIGRGEGAYPFVISNREESEFLRSTSTGAWGWMLGSAVAIIGGVLALFLNQIFLR
jgi:hypothetical protein